MRLAPLALAMASFALPTLAGTVVIGQVLPNSAPGLADDSRAAAATLRACTASINAAGGINGNKLQAVTRDDAFNPDKHVAAAKFLIEEEKAIVLLGAAGVSGPLQLIKQGVLNEAKVPLVGPIIGSEQLRNPMNPYVFHTRAGWVDEIGKIMAQMSALGRQRIAVVYQNDADGKGGLLLSKGLAKKNGLEVVGEAAYDFKTNDMTAAAKKMIDTNPDAIFLSGLDEAGGRLLKLVRPAGVQAQLFAASVVDSKNLAAIAGADARGTGISQTMPYPFSSAQPIVKEYRASMKKYASDIPISYLGMETWINCKIIAEGLKHAGPHPSGESLMQALEGLSSYDMGGYKVSFSPENRRGSRFVEITVIGGADGSLMR